MGVEVRQQSERKTGEKVVIDARRERGIVDARKPVDASKRMRR
jgi:hypothetical protein